MNAEEKAIEQKVKSGEYHAPSELGAVVMTRDMSEEEKQAMRERFQQEQQ